MKKNIKILSILVMFLVLCGTASAVTTFIVPQGGTGVNTITGVIKGNGTSAFSAAGSSDIISALTYTPYNATNPAGYITAAGAPVQSVFGRTGSVVASSGDYNTSQVSEVTNLYFTNARAIASTLTGYTSGAGTISSADSILGAIQKLNGNIGALTTGVSSVSNSDGTLTISPTSGAVTASLALGHANTWSGTQTYNGVPINEAQGGTLASASTVNIGAATGNYLTISGSVTITAFDTIQAGTRRVVTFTGTPILTNSSALVLPWGNITVVAGDSATFVSTGGGNWICTQYQRSTSTGSGAVVFAASPTFTGTTTIGALTTNSASTQSIGGVTLNIGGNTTTTTANILGGATVNTATSTVNINQGATASGGTKTTNIGTAGLAGSTTNFNVGNNTGTSTSTFNGTSIFTSTLRLKGYTVATLPAGTQGDTAFVTDALTPTFLVAVVGGGAVKAPVFFDGTNWVTY